MSQLTHNGSDGRTYGGDPNLIHIPDHHRADVGHAIANVIDATMRLLGTLGVGHEAKPMTEDAPLCPGCYMIALFDASQELARRTGQPMHELAASMAGLYTELAKDPSFRPVEEMVVRQ